MENYWSLVKAGFASDWFMALLSNIPIVVFLIIIGFICWFILHTYSKKNVITRSSLLLITEVALLAGTATYGLKNWAPHYEFVEFRSPYKEEIAKKFIDEEFNEYKSDVEKGYNLLKQNSSLFSDYQNALKKKNMLENSVRQNFDVKLLECIGEEANPQLLKKFNQENKKTIWDMRKDLTVDYMHCAIVSTRKIVAY